MVILSVLMAGLVPSQSLGTVPVFPDAYRKSSTTFTALDTPEPSAFFQNAAPRAGV